jgi:hypothetical protein
LGGKKVKFLVHYDDGSIESRGDILDENFKPGDTRWIAVNVRGYTSYNAFTKSNLFEGDVPVKVVLDPN